MPNNNSEVELELASVDLQIAGLEDYIQYHPARKLIYLIKRGGKRKAEIPDITVKQYLELTGKSRVPSSSLTPDKKHVYWYDALDSVVTEYGYKTTDELGQAIEGLHRAMRELQALRGHRADLIHELEMEKEKLIVVKTIREPAVRFGTRKRIAVNGRLTAYEVKRGGEVIGYIVAFPPTYGIYPSRNGLDIRSVQAVGGAKSVKVAKQIAKTKLNRRKS